VSDPTSTRSEWDSRSEPFQEDMRWQLRNWRIQTAGWIALGVVLLAAAAGFFSEGPLSWQREASESGDLAVEYQRFYRNGAGSSMTLHLAGSSGPGEVEVIVGQELLEALTFETITPSPVRSATTGEGIRLTFAAPGEGDVAPVHFAIRPTGVGPVRGTIALGSGKPSVPVRFFILP
jgi:hypothetical protein